MMEQQNYQNGNVGPATSNAPTGSSPAPNNNGGPVVMQSQPGAFHPHQFYGADMGSNNQLHVQNQAVLQHQQQQQQQQHFMQNNGAPFFGMSVDPSAAAAMGFDPMLRQQMMAQAAAAQAQQQQQQQQHCQQQGVYATYSSQSYGGQAGQNLQMNSGTRPADPSQQPQTQQIAGSYTSQSHLVPGGNNSTIDSSMVNSSIIGGVPAPAVSVATSMATTLHAEAASAAAAPPAKKPRGQSNLAKSSDAKDGKGPGDGQHKHQASRPSNSKKEQARRTASKRKSPPEATSSSETVGLSSTAAALIKIAMAENYNLPPPSSSSRNNNDDSSCKEMTAQEKSQANRDRNREHARCTRLRKKAYVSKLKELVDGLHAERSEEARKRRVAVQHLAEIQNIRRKVVHTFFGYHARYENDVTKWNTILEEDFWLKQPVTPYRSFRRCEIQKVRLLLLMLG